MAHPRPVLLLDVMGTLCHDPFYEDMPRWFGMTLEELLAAKHPTAWIEFELGQLSEEEFLARFFADGRDYDRIGFAEFTASRYRWLDGMEELVRDLAQAGHALHALSNYPTWYHRIEERLGVARFVKWSFVSCDTGVRKPDPQAWRRAVRELGVAPADCLFVDDRKRNCTAARALGIPTVRFASAEALRGELAERGLL